MSAGSFHRDWLGELDESSARELDALCDRFEAAWKLARQDATPPRLEDYLVEPGDPRKESLLHELIGLDIDYRSSAPNISAATPPRPI